VVFANFAGSIAAGVDGDAGKVIAGGAAHPTKVKIANAAKTNTNIFFNVNSCSLEPNNHI